MTRWDWRLLDMAALVSSWSKDPSTKCGAVITRPDRTVVSVGYNGFPRGMDDGAHLYATRDVKYQRVVHAELNAILTAREPVRGFTVHVWPFLPCPRCAVMLVQAGLSRVVSIKPTVEQEARWDLQTTRAMLDEAGVERTELWTEEERL